MSRTLHDNKDDDLKNQRMSSRLNQEHIKVQKKI